jgi:hypothetical protein
MTLGEGITKRVKQEIQSHLDRNCVLYPPDPVPPEIQAIQSVYR